MAGRILENGKQYSWGSVRLILANGTIEIEGYSEITWGQKRNRTKGRGQGRHQAPQVRSNGEYDVDNVKFAFRVDHADELRDRLAELAPDRRSYGDVEFEIMVQLVEEKVSTLEFRQATVAGEGGSYKSGPEGMMEELEFDIMRALKNGKTLYNSSEANSPL